MDPDRQLLKDTSRFPDDALRDELVRREARKKEIDDANAVAHASTINVKAAICVLRGEYYQQEVMEMLDRIAKMPTIAQDKCHKVLFPRAK